MTDKVRRQFESRVNKDGPDAPGVGSACWIWLGSRTAKGYGQFKVMGENRAHRVSYRLFVAPVPDGVMVLHKCDNPACVNPAHLKLGDHQDNMNDMTSRARQSVGERHGTKTRPESVARGDRHGSRVHPQKRPRGSRHGAARLTESLVVDIRKLHAAGQSQRSLARQFKVHQRTVYRIVHGATWVHI